MVCGSMSKALLDTDIFSEIRRTRDHVVVANATAYPAAYSRYTISALTVMEVVLGLHLVHREQQIAQFLETLPALEVLPLDSEAATLGGRIHAELRRTGRPIGWADPLIAAIALRHDLVLVTGNTSHYQRIQALGYALRLANWRVPFSAAT